MARPRTITDDEILSAVRRCVFKRTGGVDFVYRRLVGMPTTLFKRFDDKVNAIMCLSTPVAATLSLIQVSW